MRAFIRGLVLLAAAAVAGPASAEITYPWCRQSVDGGTNCGFSSLAQCGGGAYCIQNPQYQAPAPTSVSSAAARQTRRR
jgi:hypothetical protein